MSNMGYYGHMVVFSKWESERVFPAICRALKDECEWLHEVPELKTLGPFDTLPGSHAFGFLEMKSLGRYLVEAAVPKAIEAAGLDPLSFQVWHVDEHHDLFRQVHPTGREKL